MKKQIDGQLNLFDYISEEEKNFSSDIENIGNQTDENLSFAKNEKSGRKISSNKKPKADIDEKNQISLYRECIKCWCSTCRHNGKGKAVPRDFAGEKKPCPSCDFCIDQKKAEICEIGSYENGCKLRAEEEGITS